MEAVNLINAGHAQLHHHLILYKEEEKNISADFYFLDSIVCDPYRKMVKEKHFSCYFISKKWRGLKRGRMIFLEQLEVT